MSEVVYDLHTFKDVEDSMSNVINAINVYKDEGKYAEANTYAEANKNILGDTLSPTVLNEMEKGLVDAQKEIQSKKMFVIISSDYPLINDGQSWIQTIEDE